MKLINKFEDELSAEVLKNLTAIIERADAFHRIGQLDEHNKELNKVWKSENRVALRVILRTSENSSVCFWSAGILGDLHTSESFNDLFFSLINDREHVRTHAFYGLNIYSKRGFSENQKLLLKNAFYSMVDSADWGGLFYSFSAMDSFLTNEDLKYINKIILKSPFNSTLWKFAVRKLFVIDKIKCKTILNEVIEKKNLEIKEVKQVLEVYK
jgi:hypothetical protein